MAPLAKGATAGSITKKVAQNAKTSRKTGRTTQGKNTGLEPVWRRRAAVRGDAVPAANLDCRPVESVCGSGDDRRAGRLVRRGGAVPACADSVRVAPYRDHPEEQGKNRRQPGAVRA